MITLDKMHKKFVRAALDETDRVLGDIEPMEQMEDKALLDQCYLMGDEL